ncbi:MAG TPA: WbqC family protein [bacterium]|nr:WbqC family protein [bacterium]
MKTISIHQPAYLPWLGYFDKIIKSDIFVYLETVQFEKNSFTNRNKIKLSNGLAHWLTIPVLIKGHTEKQILDLKINESENWRKKHTQTIEQNYKKAKFFEIYYFDIKNIIYEGTDNFSDFLFDMFIYFCNVLNINTEIIRSKNLNISSVKSELVLDICRYLNAEKYISGKLGKDYLDLDAFCKNNIEVEFQDYNHPVYNQINGGFISRLGIIDALFNVGAEEIKKLLVC